MLHESCKGHQAREIILHMLHIWDLSLFKFVRYIKFYHIHEAAKFNYYFMRGIISYQAAQTDQLRRTQCMVVSP